MFKFDINKMLFTVPAEEHGIESITETLGKHPEVRFVSFVGVDVGGHDTDEKIPTRVFIEDMDKMLKCGVQTDGSSVVLPGIANLNNAKVDIIPDLEANWYVDYNLNNIDFETGLPVGTLRIPSFLLHNDTLEVGSRVALKDAVKSFEDNLLKIMAENPYVFDELPIDSVEDIDHLVLTSATELEFWVKTPEAMADRREELSTAQLLKEQYWKRTVGPVRTALEDALLFLDKYGFDMEMGHKEVGGVKAGMSTSGQYDHVMEQLEIDWKFTTALQAADNENHIKYVVRDVFRTFGLDVTFMAKPMDGIAGNGEHTHLGVAAKLKNGKMVNLFSPADMSKDFLSPIGFGAIMGLLKNYDVINPFVCTNNDSFNRLKPGYEAPVCVVTSLGHGVDSPSRNRTVLAGLVRDMNSPMATRFELRSPNPKSNTYLILAASYMAMLDGIEAALKSGKTSKDLEKSLSKAYGEEDFYLETERVYRSEENVFEDFTEEERDKFFGKPPATVWETISRFTADPEKLKVIERDDVISPLVVASYKEAMLAQWATELHNRILPNMMDVVRETVKLHGEDANALDQKAWEEINTLRTDLGKDDVDRQCLLKQCGVALDEEDWEKASDLQIDIQKKITNLQNLYLKYKKNLF